MNFRKRFKKWTINNKDILDFLVVAGTVIIAIGTIILVIPIIIDAIAKLKISANWLREIFSLLKISVEVPIIILILIGVYFAIFYLRSKKRLQRAPFKTSSFIGTWRNDWGGMRPGSQVFEFTKNGEYIISGVNCLKIEGLEYDSEKKKIKFIKASTTPGDNRLLSNILTMESNNLLVGTENNYEIKYTKLSD
ncbi:hypothetical protein [uncultured Mucilaginibacter sp.]|uniref:hypothetical protein n=1 Tax=uncultured Mucilaginibacter sp. TaxID=797541 RepID=UPI0025D5B73B|nr:hypothetical protein [uncultured Mucilaginibacter sp.]